MTPAAKVSKTAGLLLLAPLVCGFMASRSAAAQASDPASMRATAMALEQRGENSEAEQIWQSIASADPRNAEALAHLGLLEARQDHLEKAIEFYRQAAAIDPDLPGLQMNLGLALFKAAQFPNAIQILSAEIRKHPGDQRLTILLGMAHYGMKDYLVAIPYLERAAQNDAQNVTLRMALARSCLLSKQYQCVLDVSGEIHALKPDGADANMLAAQALDAMREDAGAVKQLQAAIQANPDEANAHFALGYLFWTKSQSADAAREFQAELDRNPQNVQASIYLADAQVQQGDLETASPELKRLVVSHPSEALVHLDLGIIAARNGRTEDALRELKAASDEDPESSDMHLRISKQYELLGRPDETRRERERATRMPQGDFPKLVDILEVSEEPGS